LYSYPLILLCLFLVRRFSCRQLRFVDSREETVEEAKAQEPAPSISSASMKNPSKDPSKDAPVVELLKNSMAEAKTKCRKKDLTQPDISLEKHQDVPSLNDVSVFLCYLLELCYFN
jgi:hypothetical protein